MKALQCEMCGSQDLVKDGGVFVCQSCGTKYSVEEAKKMMVEGTVDVKGTVKVDTSDELKNLYEIARRAKDSDNSENATKYYDMILIKDPGSWEANYYVVYFKAMGCKIAEIWSAANSVTNCLDSVVDLIKKNIEDKDERNKALNEVLIRNSSISTLLFNAAKSHYDGIDSSIQTQFLQEYLNSAAQSALIMYTYGDKVDSTFGEDASSISVEAWKDGINIHKEYVKWVDKTLNLNMINEYVEKIKKYEPSYTTPYVDTSACYVATAVYGSYDCPEVWTLRRFRDYTLDETWYGRLFIKIYYAISPTFVKHFRGFEIFKSQGRKILDKLVAKLNSKGYENTPYEDKY